MAQSSLEEYMAKYSDGRKRTRKTDETPKKDENESTLEKENTNVQNDNTETSNKDNSSESGKWVSVETKSAVDLPKSIKEDIKEPAQKKRKGGLQKQEDIEKELQIKEKNIQKQLNDLKKLGAHKNATIHRDAQGRKINDPRSNDAKDKDTLERERNERIQYMNRNEAKIVEDEKMRKRIDDMKGEGINGYQNDARYIESQKDAIKSEDPALIFNKNVIEKHKKEMDKEFVSVTGRKLYKDLRKYPMNRFNVKPGWRWDGILRGNGFEQKWHDAQVDRKK